MNLKHRIKQIKEQLDLTEIDCYMIKLWFETKDMVNYKLDLDSSLIDTVNNHAMARAVRLLSSKITEEIWEHGSINLLNAIVNQTTIDIGFLQDQKEVLSKGMLPRFSSFLEIKQDDRRKHLAKKLGIKIVV